MSDSAVQERCPTCRTYVRPETLTCPACGTKVRYVAGQALRTPRATPSRTLAWGVAHPHRVLQGVALGAALIAVPLAVTTHLLLGVVPCVIAIIVLVARRPRHSDGEGAFAYRVWLRPTGSKIARDPVPLADQRLVLTEPPSAEVFFAGFLFCGVFPIVLLLLANGKDEFGRALAAQVIAWVGMAVAYARLELRNRESEAQVVIDDRA